MSYLDCQQNSVQNFFVVKKHFSLLSLYTESEVSLVSSPVSLVLVVALKEPP